MSNYVFLASKQQFSTLYVQIGQGWISGLVGIFLMLVV